MRLQLLLAFALLSVHSLKVPILTAHSSTARLRAPLFSTAPLTTSESPIGGMSPDDSSYGFVEGPSVKYWLEYTAPRSRGLDNLREAASTAIAKARGDRRGVNYWSYHLARSTFFASQAVTGVLAFRAFGSDNSPPAKNLPGETNTLGSQSTSELVDTLGYLFAEAVATYSQDWEAVSANKLKLPWDMREGARNRQANPLYVLDQGRRFISESVAILSRRTRRDPNDIGVWADKSSLYPDYYLNNFHFQSDGWLSSDSAKVYETSTETLFLGRQDAMQRLALYSIASWVASRGVAADGEGLSVAEVACGTGRLNAFLRDNYPRCAMSATDLSPFYLEEAR